MTGRHLCNALGAGLAGACTVTVFNEAGKRAITRAPRLDVLGMRAVAAVSRAAGAEPPEHLRATALIGDLAANSLYYSVVAAGGREHAITTGAAAGLAAGVGAALLPGALGLGYGPTERTPETASLAICWYLLAGIAAGATYVCLEHTD